jgi:hypothetical protein
MNQAQIQAATLAAHNQLRGLLAVRRANGTGAAFSTRLAEVVQHLQQYGIHRYNVTVAQEHIRAMVTQYIATSLRANTANNNQDSAERARFRLLEVNLHNAVGATYALSAIPELQAQATTAATQIGDLTTAVEAIRETAQGAENIALSATIDGIENNIDTLSERLDAFNERLETSVASLLRNQYLTARVVHQALTRQNTTAAELAELAALSALAGMTI